MHRFLVVLAMLTLAACATAEEESWPFVATPVAELDEPWALAFLPDGRMLVTEKRGRLRIATPSGEVSEPVPGIPEVAYGGQGGLGDVVLHPDFAANGLVYLSYAEPGPRRVRGAAVARGRLTLGQDGGGRLGPLEVIWRQEPKVTGHGHYGHRLAFAPDGLLFVSSGERQKFDPAQDMEQNLGKIVRLRDDGSVPGDNPFADRGGIAAQVWSLGHRNPLGLAFDPAGRLWNHEMGPRGGDELNRVRRGRNYGYPIVSNGDHYDGRRIPDHHTRPEFEAPRAYWVPAISPAGLVFYTGDLFPAWRGSALLGGLSSRSLVRVEIDGDDAREAERFAMGARVREVEQGPEGAVWLLQDDGKLLKLTPRGS